MTIPAPISLDYKHLRQFWLKALHAQIARLSECRLPDDEKRGAYLPPRKQK